MEAHKRSTTKIGGFGTENMKLITLSISPYREYYKDNFNCGPPKQIGGKEMNNENLVLGTLSNDAFVMVNKKLAQKIGFVEAGLLGEMIATYRMCKSNNSFLKNPKIKGSWFYVTQPYIEKNIGIKRAGFQSAIKILVKMELVTQKKMGLPALNYYVINWDKIIELMAENDDEALIDPACTNHATLEAENAQPREPDSSNLECTNHATIKRTNKKNYIKTISKKIVNKELNKNDFIDMANSFYSEMAPSRYSKKSWGIVTNKLIDELIENEKIYSVNDPLTYIEGCLKNICYKNDLRNGKIEIEKSFDNLPFHYDWIEEEEEA